MMRRLLFLIPFLALGFSAAAQQRPEIIEFQKLAGSGSTLVRGEQAEWYGFPANGTPYWISPEFFTATIDVQGRVYYDVAVNIDAVTQRALVRVPGSQMSVSIMPSRVRRIESDGLLFVGMGPDGLLPEGFYQVFGNGPEKVYKAVHKVLSSSTDNVNGATIGYYDEHYRYDVTRYFKLRTEYWFCDADGALSRVRGKNALLGKFGSRKKELRKQAAAYAIDRLPFDQYCKALLELAQR
ncbi:MAG: hypothetical protein J5759_00750 [Bacteroidales bacterium]|nr:hypothetical protein [Bacteroidales bacterium]